MDEAEAGCTGLAAWAEPRRPEEGTGGPRARAGRQGTGRLGRESAGRRGGDRGARESRRGRTAGELESRRAGEQERAGCLQLG